MREQGVQGGRQAMPQEPCVQDGRQPMPQEPRGEGGRRVSLITKLSTLFISVLVVLCVPVFAYFAYSLQSVFDNQVSVQMDDLMGLGTANVNNQIGTVDQLSVVLITDGTVQANLPQIGDGDTSRIAARALAAAVRENLFTVDGVRTARMHNLQGDVEDVGTFFLTMPTFPTIHEDEVIAANGSPVWGVDESGNYLCLARAVLSTSTMQPIGWIEIIVDSASFDEGIHTSAGSGHGRLYLLDEADRIISSSDTSLRAETFPYAAETLLAWQNGAAAERGGRRGLDRLLHGGSNVDITDPATGEESIYRVSSSLDNDWRLVICVSRDEYYATLAHSLLRIGTFMLCAAAIVIVVVYVMIRRLSRPIGEVITQMNRFADGDMSARAQIMSRDEIGEISTVYNHMADRIQDQHERVYQLELANREAQIEFLKMQINPHFLYNSLDTMSWISYMHGDEEVSEMAVAMAGLLRASIQREDFIPVAQEILIVQDYLKIQGYRFGDKIRAHLDVDADTAECMMPGFILQPIIENSIIHGLEGRKDGGEVRISVKRLDSTIYFCVSDNGAGMSEEQLRELVAQCESKEGGKSIGIRNVYRRLHLIYGDACRITMESTRDQGTTVSFEIPIRMSRSDEPQEGSREDVVRP